MNDALEPKLAQPGAGLPKIELFIARAMFARGRRRATREGVNARFQKERDAIRLMVRSMDAEAASRRVLIPRLRGMEDSSRYWSVWMTLEHLRLIHEMMNRTIGALAKENLPAGKVSTADVKPKPTVTATVVAGYEKSCDDLLATVEATPNLKTQSRHVHPWFGPLDAAGWHTLAAVHLGIHREQIERIVQGLAAAKS